MTRLSDARVAARRLLSARRRRQARMRDLARGDEALARLASQDRALAMRLALGATAASPLLDELIDACVKRPSSLQPQVRDALQVATFELLYLDTAEAVAVSQGVELVRSVAPRAAGLANAVLRRLARETLPAVAAARAHCAQGAADTRELVLSSALPTWLVERIASDRGLAAACSLCQAQLEPAPVYVAANGARHDAASLEALLRERGCAPTAIAGLSGSFELGKAAPLAGSGLVERVELVTADLSAQLVCRIACPGEGGTVLEVGQGRATKSVLLAAHVGGPAPRRIEGVDSVAYKVRLSRRRLRDAGLAGKVGCHELDGLALASDELPPALAGPFDVVLVDAPCTGTGTMRRHPEISATLAPADVSSLAKLQLGLVTAASSRVAPGGRLVYATCSVLSEEDEDVVAAFLATSQGSDFSVEAVTQAPACAADPCLAKLVASAQTPEGYLLTMPAPGCPDGHFCAVLRRAL